MRRRVWRWVVATVIAISAAAATAWIWLRYDFEKVNWTWGVIAGFVAVYLVVDQVFKDRQTGSGALAAQRRVLLDELADLVRRDPAEDALLKALEEPYALPVRWVNAPEEMQPPWRTICRSSEATRLDLSGQADTLRDCFEAIRSGRLLVLGAPGSGKSIMALRLARHLATTRSADGPVPVLLGVSSWDPTATTFYEWIVAQIANRYPQLATVHARWQEALRDLVETDLILPILDGLDESSDDHAARCLEEFNELPAQRLVLTCRRSVYEKYLLQGEKLRGAAVIVIEPLDPARVANYLVDAAPFHQVANWSAVSTEITRTRDTDLTAALSTPLMVAMARTAFDEPGTDPRNLVLLAHARGRQSVEDELLTSAIDAALRSRRRSRLPAGWQPDAARRYLSFLATHLEARGQREFLWWRLPAELPRPIWVLFDGLRTALAVMIAFRLAEDALVSTASTVDEQVVRDLLLFVTGKSALWAALAAGWSALVSTFDTSGTAQGVSPTRIAIHGGLRPMARGMYWGALSGLLWGIAVWLTLSVFEPPVRIMEFAGRFSLPIDVWPSAVTVALTVGLARMGFVVVRAGFHLHFAAPADELGMTTAPRLVRGDRAATVLSLLPMAATAVALVFVLFGALSLANAMPEAPRIITQVYAGVGIGLGLWIYHRTGSAWIRFGIARFLLAARGRLPLRLLRFLAFVDAVGLLRSVGGAYRFRHGRLQTRLAQTTERSLHIGWQQQDFGTELARAGYLEEALTSFGAVLTAHAGSIGLDDALTSETIRKAIFTGCLGGRWRQAEQYLTMIPGPVASLGGPGEDAATKRREISKLLSDEASLLSLLGACDELIDVEVAAGRIEPSTLEFRSALLIALGDAAAATAQLHHLIADVAETDDVERCTPVASALLARIALDEGAVDQAMELSEHELRPRYTAADVDLLLRAEAWRWSVQVMARAFDELDDLRRRLTAAAERAHRSAPIDFTGREIAEMVLLACNKVITRPIFGALALLIARRLAELMQDTDGYLRTVDRSAPMWLYS